MHWADRLPCSALLRSYYTPGFSPCQVGARIARPPLRFAGTCGILKVALRKRQAVGHTTRKGVSPMRITIHIGPFTVTVIVKSRNRHPGR